MIKRAVLFLIRLYQLCLSPFFGRCCRFAPTCSEYACEVIEKYGFFRGILLTLKRVIKCGPWHPGGYDPAP